MKTQFLAGTAALLSITLAGCGPSFEGPDEDDLTSMLQIEMDEGIAVDDVEIVAVQTVGDEIEPRYRTRADIDLVLEEDFAELVRYVDDRPVVKIVSEKGTELPAVLFTRSEPIGDDWDINIEKVDIKKRRGAPLSTFENHIIEGSREEKQAVAAARRKNAEREKEMKEAQAERRAAFVGTWKSSRPVMRPGNRTWTSDGDPLTIEVTLQDSKDGAGTGTITLKSLTNSAVSASGPITYVINDGEQQAIISVPQEIRLPDRGSWLTAGNTWNLYRGGKFELSNRKQWNVQLNPPN